MRPLLPSAYFATDTIVYAASGHGAVISDNGKTRQELAPGDFALIPAWTEHQEVNEGDEEVTVRLDTFLAFFFHSVLRLRETLLQNPTS